MSKKNYTHIQFLKSEIWAMKESGKTKREIAEHYGLKMEQVKGLLKQNVSTNIDNIIIDIV